MFLSQSKVKRQRVRRLTRIPAGLSELLLLAVSQPVAAEKLLTRIVVEDYRRDACMFCPRCATENGLEVAYCRKCGQTLVDVHLAIEARPTESLEQLKAGAKWLNGGIATLIVFTIIGVLITIVGIEVGSPVLGTIAMLNVLLGALIGVPLVLVGKASMKRATRLLSRSQIDSGSALTEGQQQLFSGGVRPELAPPGSVTEGTTLHLRKPNENKQTQN